MDASDIYLERALEEYNQSVNESESRGPSEELVEAYVNRGCVLYMMEYYTSAMEDLVCATEMIDDLESKGVSIDAGTYVKAHATIGSILFLQNEEVSEAYSNAISRLDSIDEKSRHYDRTGIMRLCIESAENLLDFEYPDDAIEFIDKGLSIALKHGDRWSMNRCVDLYNLKGEALLQKEDSKDAIDAYTKAIESATGLLEKSELEDVELLVAVLISRADCECELGMKDQYLTDMKVSIQMMEEMMRCNKLKDTVVLTDICHEVASELMSRGNMEEAEKFLLKAMTININGAKDYIRDQTNNSNIDY